MIPSPPPPHSPPLPPPSVSPAQLTPLPHRRRKPQPLGFRGAAGGGRGSRRLHSRPRGSDLTPASHLPTGAASSTVPRHPPSRACAARPRPATPRLGGLDLLGSVASTRRRGTSSHQAPPVSLVPGASPSPIEPVRSRRPPAQGKLVYLHGVTNK